MMSEMRADRVWSPSAAWDTVDVRGPVAENSPRAQIRLSVSTRAVLAEEYARGVPVDDLVRRFGIHRTMVQRLASQAGVAVRRRGLDEPGRREAARLNERGMTLEEVAAEQGVGDESVRPAIVACGGTIRPRVRRPRHGLTGWALAALSAREGDATGDWSCVVVVGRVVMLRLALDLDPASTPHPEIRSFPQRVGISGKGAVDV